MSDNDGDDSQASLTDQQKLQDAEDTIHELQHELERLQLDAKQKKEANDMPSSSKEQETIIQSLRDELAATKEKHAAEVKELQDLIVELKNEYDRSMTNLQQEQQQQVQDHQKNMEELGNLLKFRQQEQLDTLQDFTAKLTQVGQIHSEAIQSLEAQHKRQLEQQKIELTGK